MKRNPRLRIEVYRRDKGVCSDCGLDTEALLEAYLRAVDADGEHPWFECPVCMSRYAKPKECACGHSNLASRETVIARQIVELVLKDHGYTPGDCKRLRASDGAEPRLWEADHIIPRAEKGPDTLENMRTLCLPCHRAWTKGLKQRLPHLKRLEAKARRTHEPVVE